MFVSRKERIKALIAEYGKTAVIFHFGVYFLVFGVGAGLFLLGAGEAHAGPLGAAASGYALTQLTSPPRYALTFAVTPFLARILRPPED